MNRSRERLPAPSASIGNVAAAKRPTPQSASNIADAKGTPVTNGVLACRPLDWIDVGANEVHRR